MRVPALCPSCGGISEIRLPFAMGPGTRVHLAGNMTNCPYCGSIAQVADGVFEIAAGAIKIISAPDITSAMLTNFGQLISATYQGKASTDNLEESARIIDLRLGAAVQLAKQSNGYTWVVLLMLAFFISQCVNVDVDANRLIDQMIGLPPERILGSLNSIEAEQEAEQSAQHGDGHHASDPASAGTEREHKPVPRRKPTHLRPLK